VRYRPPVTFEETEQALRQRLEAPPAARAELIHVMRLRDLDRVERIGEFWSSRRAAPSRNC
jgi:hypothetical protein